MTTTTNVTTELLRNIVIEFNACVIGERCTSHEEEKEVNDATAKAKEMLDAWDRTVEEIMTMLADVPGDDMLSKVKKLKEWYQALCREWPGYIPVQRL